MNYQQLIFEPRQRPAWQAIDVGCLIARRFFIKLWLCWMATALPIAVLLSVLYLSGEHDWGSLELILLWWMKPLYERAPLLFLSRQVFGQSISLKELFSKHSRLLLSGLFADLSYRRLSFNRSMDMPVALLEQQSGSARSKRLNILHRSQARPSASWTLILVHLEQFILYSFIIMIGLSLPASLFEDIEILELATGDEYMREVFFSQFILYAMSMSIIAPFYTAGGFILYLNRRIHLEGWDLQLMFQKPAAQAERSAQVHKSSAQTPQFDQTEREGIRA